MMPKACLDTGVITLFYSTPLLPQISQLKDDIFSGRIDVYVVSPVLVEAFAQLCKLQGGIDYAERVIIEFLSKYPVKLVSLNQALIIKAGQLKCKHRNKLSLTDCIAIGFAINKKMQFHTTEKELDKLFPKLPIFKYTFD
jgi:PIN domain nuclease of toxin-antitoxin system